MVVSAVKAVLRTTLDFYRKVSGNQFLTTPNVANRCQFKNKMVSKDAIDNFR